MMDAWEHRGFVVAPQGYKGTLYLYRVGTPATFVAVDTDGASRFYHRGLYIEGRGQHPRPEAIERACDWLEEEVRPDV